MWHTVKPAMLHPRHLGLLLSLTGCEGAFCDRWAIGCPTLGPPSFVDRDQDGWLAEEDCDDSKEWVSPSELEDCDSIDNDCDGLIDEPDGLVPTWYPDPDGDGYGQPDGAVVTCEPPAGYALYQGDCDESDPDINYGETDVCNAGTDRDCSGQPESCSWTGSVALWVYGTTITTRELSSEGTTTRLVGDLDGDGWPELAFATTHSSSEEGGIDKRVVYLLETEENVGLAELHYDEAASATLIDEEEADAALGTSLSAGGDLDGDGIPDLLVGTPGWSGGSGAVLVFLGPVQGERNTESVEGQLGGETDEGLGAVLEGAVDLDGDGTLDLVAGSRRADRVVVAFGPPLPTAAPGLSLAAPTAGDHFGAALLVADLSGDGLPELIIGAPGDGSSGTTGAVYVFLGPLGPETETGDALYRLEGPAADDRAGMALAAGDLDGDGAPDLLVGGPGAAVDPADPGAAWALHSTGSLSGLRGTLSLSAADLHLQGTDVGDRLGMSVACPGDFDGDGAADLLVASPRVEDEATLVASEAWLIPGYSTGSNRVNAGAHIRFDAPYAAGGLRLSPPPGDLNGDGAPELLFTFGDEQNGIGGGTVLLYGAPVTTVE